VTLRPTQVADKLAGKRVAVVGTGASAMQLLRNVAVEAAHVTVFQQIPSWSSPAIGGGGIFVPPIC
jgi:cation diffusion facilitator CzcD-associated flavoprotein CzcO